MISEKIVVVDDDDRVHQSLKLVLFEHELIFFSDPEKALKYLLRPNEVKLVLMDVCMQGLNGIELLEYLRRAKKETPVMMITAHGSQDIVVEAMRMGANDYVEKPFDVAELRERVSKILKEHSRYDAASRDPHNQMERVRQFIQRNYTNASLDYIAKEMCLTPQYLGRLFIQNNGGGGFREYKIKVRMEKAMELLRATSLDISEIAFQLGYQNPESFMRTFKSYVHKTPSVYRDQHSVKKP